MIKINPCFPYITYYLRVELYASLIKHFPYCLEYVYDQHFQQSMDQLGKMDNPARGVVFLIRSNPGKATAKARWGRHPVSVSSPGQFARVSSTTPPTNLDDTGGAATVTVGSAWRV